MLFHLNSVIVPFILAELEESELVIFDPPHDKHTSVVFVLAVILVIFCGGFKPAASAAVLGCRMKLTNA